MAIDCRDDEFWCLFKSRKSFVRVQTKVILELRRHLAQHLNIRTRTKEFFAAAGNHNHLRALIHSRFEDAGVQLLHHLIRISIRRRIVECHYGYSVADNVLDQIFLCHYGFRIHIRPWRKRTRTTKSRQQTKHTPDSFHVS